MSSKRDYYEILGVAKAATDQEMKSAYRKLALQYHPDRNPGDKQAEDRFKEAAEAYSVLTDAQKRAAYDRYGHAGLGGAAGGNAGFDPSVFADFSDVLGDIFGFGDMFGGGGRRGGNRVQRGSDLRYDLELRFEDAAFGATKTDQVFAARIVCGVRRQRSPAGKRPFDLYHVQWSWSGALPAGLLQHYANVFAVQRNRERSSRIPANPARAKAVWFGNGLSS